MIPNFTDSGLTNIMKDEKLRNDYMDTRYSRLEKGLSKSQNSGDAAGMNGNKVWKSRISAIILIVVGGLFGGSFDGIKISLGDRLFSVLGIPAWSDGTTGRDLMKKRRVIFVVSLSVVMLLWTVLGVGYRPSGATLYALNEQLVSMYGEEYERKQTENGWEDMEFHINPKTFFASNWSFRHFFSLPYEYECQTVFKIYDDEGYYKSRTITYQAFDPMGYENENEGAYIVLESMKETESDTILLTK